MTLRPYRLPKWFQYSGLALAGSLSFYVATLASGYGNAAPEEADLLARPAGSKMNPPLPAQQTVSAKTLDQRQPLQVGVRQDAFAPINPAVTIEQLTAPVVPLVPVKRQPAKAPVPATIVVESPPPPPPVVTPVPTAPPLPFKVMGALQGERIGDGQRTVFLSSIGKTATLVVKAGDLIDSTYRVTAISDRQIDFVYLPLQTPQSLPLDK